MRSIYTIHVAYLKVYTKFHNPKSSNCWENSDEKCPYVLDRRYRRKNWKEGKLSFSILIFIYTIHFANLKVCTKFENTGSSRNWGICDRNLYWRERNMNQIKELISNMWLFFVTQYNLSLSSFVPNFRILSQVVAEKSLTEKNVHMYYIGVTERKIKNLKKEGKIRTSI